MKHWQFILELWGYFFTLGFTIFYLLPLIVSNAVLPGIVTALLATVVSASAFVIFFVWGNRLIEDALDRMAKRK